jgi:DNA-binding MarR family transcriptional regulator
LPAFYVPGQYRADQSVGYLMRKVLSSVVAQADARLAAFDLTYVQWVPLYKLIMGEGNTANAMARDLAIDPAALTRALDRLQAKGLIQRDRSTADRRVVHISLTDAGREVAQHVPAVLAEVLNGHLVGFAEPEWRQMVDGLTRMLANGDAMRDAARDTPRDALRDTAAPPAQAPA